MIFKNKINVKLEKRNDKFGPLNIIVRDETRKGVFNLRQKKS